MFNLIWSNQKYLSRLETLKKGRTTGLPIFFGLLIFEFTALCCTGMHRVYFARMHAAK